MENRTTNENGNSTRLQNRYLDTVYDTIMQYHENTSQYNSNMQNIIRILEETQHTYFASSLNRDGVNRVHSPAVGSRRSRGVSRPTRQTGISQPRAAGGGPRHGQRPSLSQPRAAGGGIQSPLTRDGVNNNYPLNDNSLLFTYMFQSDVGETPLIQLSSTEISRHTTTYGCSVQVFCDISGNRCPISLDNFQIGDVIMKITGCGHIFKRVALMRWFERSNSCPVCRYNLRETQVDNSNNSVPLVDNSNNSVPLVDNSNNTFDISNNIMNELNNTLNESFNTMIQTLANELQTNSQYLFDISMNIPINLNTNNEQQTNGETTQEVSVQDVESESDDEIDPDLSVD
jgi:hypothetical protein